jgi:hypothetical protein
MKRALLPLALVVGSLSAITGPKDAIRSADGSAGVHRRHACYECGVKQRACVRMVGLVFLAALCGESLSGCSSGGAAGGAPDGGGQDATGGTSSSSSGSSSSGSSSGATGSSSGGSSSGGSSSGEAGSTGSSSGGSPGDGGAGAGDGFEASRAACIGTINALRAASDSGALQAYTLKDDDATNLCVDTQASNDQGKNLAHDSFENGSPSCIWADAAAAYQSECTGYGTTPAGIEQCIKDMWSEGAQPHCAGCVGCAAPAGGCANCDYYGTQGYACGDYVNLSSPLLTTVACGFGGSPPSSATGWSVVNVE